MLKGREIVCRFCGNNCFSAGLSLLQRVLVETHQTGLSNITAVVLKQCVRVGSEIRLFLHGTDSTPTCASVSFRFMRRMSHRCPTLEQHIQYMHKC